MKIKSLALTSVSAVLLFSFSLTTPTFAQSANKDSYTIGKEALAFLQDHKVDVTPFKKSYAINDKIYSKQNPSVGVSKSSLYDEEILSLKQQAAAYNFTDGQIQQYVKGIVNTTPTIINDASVSTTSYSVDAMPLSTRTDSGGVGYEVKSTSGWNQATAFATIPTAYRATGTSGYMFYTVSSPTSNWAIDVGLWYGSGYDGTGWRGVYNSNDPAPTGGQHATTGVLSALTPGKVVYLQSKVRSDGYLETKVLDGKDFSIVYDHQLYYVGSHNIYTSNAIFNRQITLCTDSGVFTNGSYMRNAKFSSAYLYSNTGYAPVSSTNTVSGRRGAFGSNSTTVNKVTVNSYTQWDSEDISIQF